MSKVKENLHLNLNNLLENNDHFLCKVINERYHYYHKCIFTGEHVFMDIGVAVSQWEKSKINEIVNNKPEANVENYFAKNNLFKINKNFFSFLEMATCFTCVNCFNSNPKKLNDSFEEAGKKKGTSWLFLF